MEGLADDSAAEVEARAADDDEEEGGTKGAATPPSSLDPVPGKRGATPGCFEVEEAG